MYRNWNLSRGAGFTYGHGVAGGGVKGGMMGERGSVFLLILKLRNSSSLSFDLKKLQPFAMGALRVLAGCPFIMLLSFLFFGFMAQRGWMY